ncbi:phosphate/phosphite/phosphonate ABC transporter substrate-binding protein [Trinickia acidisoli]|uniref:phosphate/phosphite/phosphonate ABC transporter substrate-binding protein n=1 Tax=Trinickia acidisoli TaxID=2767482 RepID=UPI001F5C79AB|nr:PhnD/SsuA/transferrin family substrate-binding protein [Trinickia acidisoli]
MPIANARMYSVNPVAREDWKALFHWILDRANLEWSVIDYDAPAPLAALWQRTDLGAAMMCGLPFAQRSPQPQLIAAPIPSLAHYGGRPVYFTEFAVAAKSAHRTLEDTFGGRIGYTLDDSMSGGVAVRHHLAPYRAAGKEKLYRDAIGGLVNARGVIAALDAGTIDVGPLDSYYHDLLRAYEPELASKVRVVASTKFTPIPPVVSTASLNGDVLSRLRMAFGAVESATELAPLKARLLLSGFAFPDVTDYQALSRIAGHSMPAFGQL